ncbi:HTH domain-containing protein [Vagococcus sp. BWB3-3]|uniref:HTH domain-containing protein n=1 Tax=Vagococcus allomyrinae TaxID=2794353 RepID=A0A940PC46_9ENTE|nr:HTH domain-containing protein [Vagococcus allomyrinae]MBP1043381.1 HTH domain-containing protein [Vagococcus allomyrinae]
MKKVERINTMMRYINNRAHFTISDIMAEFKVSRSTAIRDVNEIESMGMPLVSEVGRSGGYFVMNNSFLPAIRFTTNEVKALFIAFMATRNQQLPYLNSRQSLAEKLLGLIPENQQDELVILNQLLLFEGTNPHNPDLLDLADFPHPMLEKLIQTLLIDRYLLLSIKEQGKERSLPIYLLHLYREKSSWYLEGLDLATKIKQSLPVDNIENVALYEPPKRMSAKKIQEVTRVAEVNLIIELGIKAILQFKKYSPHGLSLSYLDPFQRKALLKTFVAINDPDTLEELANWLLFLGEDLTIRRMPSPLLALLKHRKIPKIEE